MWQYLLAQETYEAYRDLSEHYLLKYEIVNPYSPTNMGRPGYCFFPWGDRMLPIAIWLFFVALILFWVYRRINVASLYCHLSLACATLAGTLLYFFRTSFPSHVGVLLAYLSIAWILGCFVGFLVMLLIDKLPNFGVPENYLLHPVTGFPKRFIAYVVAAVLVVVMWSLSFKVGKFVLSEFNGDASFFWMTNVIYICLIGTIGNAVLPWVTLYDKPLLGGGYMQTLRPLLVINGPAQRYEIMFSCVSVCVLYAIVCVWARGSVNGADFMGLVLMSVIGMSIIRAENTRTSEVIEAKVERKKGLWN